MERVARQGAASGLGKKLMEMLEASLARAFRIFALGGL